MAELAFFLIGFTAGYVLWPVVIRYLGSESVDVSNIPLIRDPKLESRILRPFSGAKKRPPKVNNDQRAWMMENKREV